MEIKLLDVVQKHLSSGDVGNLILQFALCHDFYLTLIGPGDPEFVREDDPETNLQPVRVEDRSDVAWNREDAVFLL